MNTQESRAELEQLQLELATRQSTTHFAHAAVSLTVALIIAGAAAKLFYDSAKVPYLGFLATLAALGLFTYSTIRFRRGNRALKQEVAQFEKLKGLHRALGLDDPSTLLPGR